MNKDFWERIDRLEELAGKAMPGRWAYGLEAEKLGATYPDSNRVYAKLHGHYEPAGILVTVNHNLKLSDTTAEYIAAANPAMIQEMIAVFKGRLSFLEHELVEKDIELENTKTELKRLEKEADGLSEMIVRITPFLTTKERWRKLVRESVGNK